MLLCIVVLLNLLFTIADQNIDSAYCDIDGKSCESQANFGEEKFMFYDVNPPEGFNLRRDVYMRFAIMLAEAQEGGKREKWKLVLPPWYRLYHWRTQSSKSKPVPWSQFFDVSSLKSYAPVVELHELFTKFPKKPLEIDVLFVLQNFADPFEGGTFVDKWVISNEECEYDGQFWGYKNVTAREIVCVQFQGKISKLWELVSLHPTASKIMFSHGEIPLHDTYGTKQYWDCRKSMKFNTALVEIAKKYIRNHLDCNSNQCSSYIGIHWRRQDFSKSRKKDVPSVIGTVSQINNFVKKHCLQIKKIFIATDGNDKEINALEKELVKLGYKVYFYLPNKSVLEAYSDGGIAIIDQIICSYAAFFIGTHESTFSFRIQEEREINGFDSKTTFNRLCPDSGKCEEPAQWTIVN